MRYVLALLLPLMATAAEHLRLVPVNPTPEARTVVLAIAIPENGQVVNKNPIYIQFRIDGFSLGADSAQFARSKELPQTDMGQTIHIVIDNLPYFPVNEPPMEPFNESGYYYDMSYKIEVPYTLKEGPHIIRMFPSRDYGESLKGDKTFQVAFFYVGKEGGHPGAALTKPFITYNEPSNQFYYEEKNPVLLDFLISNCELSKDGYKVKLTVDGEFNRTITSWQPYYLYGLPKGNHTIRLELLDRNNTIVPGMFNKVQGTFEVH